MEAADAKTHQHERGHQEPEGQRPYAFLDGESLYGGGRLRIGMLRSGGVGLRSVRRISVGQQADVLRPGAHQQGERQ